MGFTTADEPVAYIAMSLLHLAAHLQTAWYRFGYLLVTIALFSGALGLMQLGNYVDDKEHFIRIAVATSVAVKHEGDIKLVLESHPPGLRLKLEDFRSISATIAMSVTSPDGTTICDTDSDSGVIETKLKDTFDKRGIAVRYAATINPKLVDTVPFLSCDITGDVVERRTYTVRSVQFELANVKLPGNPLSRLPMDLSLFTEYHATGDVRVDGGIADTDGIKRRTLAADRDPIEIGWTDYQASTRRDVILLVIGTLVGAAASTVLEWLRPFFQRAKGV